MPLHVLAVDDSRTIRDLVHLTLSGAGHVTRLAGDGADALAQLDARPRGAPPPDVVLTDMNMPRLDGLGLIAALRARADTRMTPILVLSTETAPGLHARARDAGASGWIVKPFEADRLLRALALVAG